MCSETFLRLPEEKRNRFLNAAWEEFTRTRFIEVSINQIVRKAGIPRGSFYQYFLDKDDLFAYLLEEVRNHVKAEYRKALTARGGDIFQAQIECFDRMASQELMQDPVMARCMKFLSILRCQDEGYARNVFGLLMAALGSAVMDTMCQPERRQEFREELEMKLEIIKNGCLKK